MSAFSYSNTSGIPGTLTGLREKGSYTNILYNRNFTTTTSGSTHQRRLFVPFGGQFVRVRFIYEAPTSAASWTVQDCAIASGRLYSETEPKDSAGAPVVWQTQSAIVATAGSATANTIVETYSQWFTLYVIPDSVYPTWGTIIMRNINTAGQTGQMRGFTGSTGKLNPVNAVAARYQDTYEYAVGTAIISDTFTLASSPDPTADARNIAAFQYQIEPAGKNFVIASSGDSRQQGQGATGNLYGWLARSCEAVTINTGVSVGFESYSITSSTHATFHAYAMDRLAKTGRKQVDLYALQGSSSNDASPWSDATLAANMARNLEFASTCRTNNIQPAFILMYPSAAAGTADQVANWVKMNTSLLATGVPCFDFYNQPLFTDGAAIPILPTNRGITADSAHLNDAGHNAAAQLIGIPGVRSYLGI